jgi:hypothetical protein
MQTSADFVQEREELDRVLASGIFNRAPNLATLLAYVCSRYFEGTGDQLKEYNIAVDALGRSPDFDQKRHSIVRVEAHRLRKRLHEYYEGPGADHPLRIYIPPGQYAPQFLPAGRAAGNGSLPAIPDEESVAPSMALERVAVVPPPPSNGELALDRPSLPWLPATRWSRGFLIPAAALLVCCAAAIAMWKGPAWARRGSSDREAGIVAAFPAGGDEVRILAGHVGGDYTDRLGRVWRADRYFQGGSVFESVDHPIFGTPEPRLYQNRREGAFEYAIPVAPGVYEMRLHFAETLYGENNVAGGGEASRLFNVHLNGREILHEFDIVSEVGSSTADIRAFKDVEPASDGKIHLRFEPLANPPILSAIEISPGLPGRMKPVRMVALDRLYTDPQGRVWEPDRYARGGQLVARTRLVQGASDPELFRGERFGNIRYVIPVSPGRYGVTLYAAEAWFGPGAPPGGGAGSRIFDILANGIVLRRSFDLFKEAGGAARAATLAFHGLEPDARGKLSISLEPVRNYACINAIEVLDESR